MNIQELIALADILDENGEYAAAKQVDAVIREAAQVFVPEEDKELKEKLREEGFVEPQVYTARPATKSEESEMKSEQKARMLESMHKTLAESGYDVFPPGDLKVFLEHKYEEWSEGRPSEEKLPEPQAPEPVEMPGDLPQMPSLEFKMEEGDQGEERFAATRSTIERLASLADRLDALGATQHADMIDKFLEKYAGSVLPDVLDWKEADPDGNRAKAYDTKHHHSLQVREPKADQERVDFEGRKYHHIDTYESASKAKDTKKEAAPHATLQTRYSPDLVGVQLARIGDGIYQCPITGKTYNFETGYTDMDGDYHPGSSVAAQTPDSSGYGISHRVFDSREQVVNRINA